MKINADDLILAALKEDITSEDITTNSVMPRGLELMISSTLRCRKSYSLKESVLRMMPSLLCIRSHLTLIENAIADSVSVDVIDKNRETNLAATLD